MNPAAANASLDTSRVFAFLASFRPTRRRFHVVCALAVVVACASQAGCVRRRMTVRSNPPGAMLYVDDYPIGNTPISHNFTYYGTRKIRLVKPGYETLTVMQRIPPPWYEIPPLDFISENLLASELRDRRTLNYQLVPQKVVPTEEFLGRAEELRREAQLSGIVRSWPSVPGGAIPVAPTRGSSLGPGPPPSGGVRVPELPSGAWPQPIGP